MAPDPEFIFGDVLVTDDSVVLTRDGPLRGLSEIKVLFEKIAAHVFPPGSEFEMLRKEIVLTEEVWSSVLRWKTHGCTALGLSDKPKEACFPEQALNSLSTSPLHHTFTHVVGNDR